VIGTNSTGAAFHCARRFLVFDRDIFRFGTAIDPSPLPS
jgi:hypothetical protein